MWLLIKGGGARRQPQRRRKPEPPSCLEKAQREWTTVRLWEKTAFESFFGVVVGGGGIIKQWTLVWHEDTQKAANLLLRRGHWFKTNVQQVQQK